jgi:hypothetical protein
MNAEKKKKLVKLETFLLSNISKSFQILILDRITHFYTYLRKEFKETEPSEKEDFYIYIQHGKELCDTKARRQPAIAKHWHSEHAMTSLNKELLLCNGQ